MNRLLYLFMFLGFSFNSCNTLTERIDGFFVHGIDVSHHQGEIDWLIVGQEGVQFVFVKATEGGDHVDSLYSKNWSSIEKVGVKKGAYHYYRPGIHPQTQADNFINTVTLISGDLAPVVDVEVTDNVDKITLQKNLKTYLEIIESNYGIKPIIYSSQKFFLKNLLPFVNEYPTWVARYNSIAPRISFEKNWAFWQYGDHGKIRGIDGPVDLNVFKGTLRELEMFSIPGDRLLSLSK